MIHVLVEAVRNISSAVEEMRSHRKEMKKR